MKIKVLSLALAFILGFTVLYFQVAKGSSKDEADIRKAVNSYLKYIGDYQTFPQENNILGKVTTDKLNNIITEKKKQIDKSIKEGSELYNDQCHLIDVAFQNQNITYNEITDNITKESKDIIAEKEKNHPINKQINNTDVLSRCLGGTVTEINFKDIKISDNTAHVDVMYKLTRIFADQENGGWKKNTASSYYTDSIDLEKDSSGSWLLVKDASDFAPGYEP